jgi:hypothetical protein
MDRQKGAAAPVFDSGRQATAIWQAASREILTMRPRPR